MVGHVLLTLHTLGEEEREEESRTDGRTERKGHGQMGGVIEKESKERLSHVQERCGDNVIIENWYFRINGATRQTM